MQHFSVKIGELFIKGGGQPSVIGRPDVFDVPAKDQPQAEAKARQKYIERYGSNPLVLRTLFVGLGRNVKRGDRRQIAEMEARLNAKWFLATGELPKKDSAFSWSAIPKPKPIPAITTPKPLKPKAVKAKTVKQTSTPKQTPMQASMPKPEPIPTNTNVLVGIRTETYKIDRESNTF